MSIPETIISKCLTELAYITIANSYGISILSVTKGFKPLNECNDYPHAFFYLQNETFEPMTSDNKMGESQLELFIGIHFSTDNLRGNLTDMCETIINNVIWWKIQKSTITANKWSTITAINGVHSYYITNIFRTFDFDKNQGTVLFQFNIKYGLTQI